MKILWFTNTPSLYDQGKHTYHGGGWIESLEQLITDDNEIELGVSFFHATDSAKVKRNNTTYFPILRTTSRKKPIKSLVSNWSGKLPDNDYKEALLAIVDSFTPDVIHVFGTEGVFATIQNLTTTPVVIHLQGLINPYLNVYFPVNQSKWNFILSPRFFWNNIFGNSPAFGVKRFKKQAKREATILREANYVMGRTHWDKMVAKLYNPDVKYFHIDEALRPVFYQNRNHRPSNQVALSIISTVSPTIYKGIDVLLRSAKKMTEHGRVAFRWQVVGLDKNDLMLKHFEDSEKIQHQDVNIECAGRKDPVELTTLLARADVFVHPSYIDNSPNSVCEAQMMGLPVIACNVGGLSSLVTHGETGFLVPANGIFEIVHYLNEIALNKERAEEIGIKAMRKAQKRHNKNHICKKIKTLYLTLSEPAV